MLSQAELAIFQRARAAFQRVFQEILQRDGRGIRRVAVDQEKIRVVAEQSDAIAEQVRQVLVEFPRAAVRRVAERRRVHEDAVVLLPALQFAHDEFLRVVQDPPDGIRGKPAQRLVVLRPTDGRLAGVDVGHAVAERREHHARGAGVPEQIEDFPLLLAAQDFRHPFPVGRLLREDARVLERRQARVERHRFAGNGRNVVHRPKSRHARAQIPAAFFPDGHVHRVCLLPLGVRQMLAPNDLRIRAGQAVRAPLLQTVTVAGIEQPEIRERRGVVLQELFHGATV